MVQDITGIIRSLHTTAVNRCRERLDEAALRARGLITRADDPGDRKQAGEESYGVTSILKKRHGL
jgi:hypothetical protein